MRPQPLDLPDFHSSLAASFHVASMLFFRSAAHIATDDGRSVSVRPVWRSAPALHRSCSVAKFRTGCPKSETGKFTAKSEVSDLAMIARTLSEMELLDIRRPELFRCHHGSLSLKAYLRFVELIGDIPRDGRTCRGNARRPTAVTLCRLPRGILWTLRCSTSAMLPRPGLKKGNDRADALSGEKRLHRLDGVGQACPGAGSSPKNRHKKSKTNCLGGRRTGNDCACRPQSSP